MTTSEDILEAIRRSGRDAYPEEGCGFLLGTTTDGANTVTAVAPVANRRAENRRRRYGIEPADYLAADRQARGRGLDIVGVYHSHPDHPAVPSETDLQEATFPGYTYVIVSIRGGEPAELTAWRLATDRSRFVPEAITLPTP